VQFPSSGLMNGWYWGPFFYLTAMGCRICRLIYRINVAHCVLKRTNAVWNYHRCETGSEFHKVSGKVSLSCQYKVWGFQNSE
jgi:hypothetical protein